MLLISRLTLFITGPLGTSHQSDMNAALDAVLLEDWGEPLSMIARGQSPCSMPINSYPGRDGPGSPPDHQTFLGLRRELALERASPSLIQVGA